MRTSQAFLAQQIALEEYTDLARQMDKTLLLGIATVFLLAFQLRKALITRAKVRDYAT